MKNVLPLLLVLIGTGFIIAGFIEHIKEDMEREARRQKAEQYA